MKNEAFPEITNGNADGRIAIDALRPVWVCEEDGDRPRMTRINEIFNS